LFLEQINKWRIILGNEIYSHNASISEAELNDIVQRYINSIIFLRVCEDRDLETYKSLLNLSNIGDFNALIDKFKTADRKYNSGLFNHPLNNEIIENNSSAFWTIIQQLYYPESTYSFSVFASDILGNIYEIFLGYRLTIINGFIGLDKKPEHIDRDVITTPTAVIRDILRFTVQKYCENKTDDEIFQSTFADIACGSGAFLLEGYQFINDYLIDYYLQHSPDRLIQISINTYKLPFELKKKLLVNCIFGIDKDFNAVEACKFGLLLKLLENENNNTISTPALPVLNKNILFGNSLIERVEETGTEHAINPFELSNYKFDVIIGNPPYMSTEDMKKFTPLELPIYKDKYISAYKQFDKYFLFIERGYNLLRENGYLGYIVPNKFTKVGAGTKLRKLLKEEKATYSIISFGANQIFQDKTTYTCLLFLRKQEEDKVKYLEVNDLTKWRIRDIKANDYDEINVDELTDNVWVLVPSILKNVYQKISNQSTSLVELIGVENIYNGIQTSANDIYVLTPYSSDADYLYFKKDGRDWKIERSLTKPYFKTSSGIDNLNTYRPFAPNSFVIYPYIKTISGIDFININELELKFPNAFAYLSTYKDKLSDPHRDIKPTPLTPNEWYRYGRHQSLDKCDVPAKIIVGVLSQGNKYAIDYYRTLISSGGTAGYCMITMPENFQYSIYYIQALLNSKYLEWYSALIGEVFRGGYIARGTKVLKNLPIRVVNFEDTNEKQLHDKISLIQEKLINIQGNIDQSINNERDLVPLQREFASLKVQLDELLKNLYQLDDDDKLIPLISEIYETN
jgi:type I restriction-modification system DNA methylase subunit